MHRVLGLTSIALVLLGGRAEGQPCVQPPEGMVAWWSFDETSGSVAEDRVGGFTGSYTNGVAPDVGLVRSALSFDGVDGYVTAPDSDVWAFGTRDFTIELWANFNTTGSGSIGEPGDIFIGNDEGPNNRNKWFFALGGGYLNFHINSPSLGPRFFPKVPFTPIPGQWYHLAVTRSGTTFTIYVNGIAQGSAEESAAIPNANAPLTIGQAEMIGFMDGRLDEVAVFDRALSPEELEAIADSGSAGKCIELSVEPPSGGSGGDVTLRVEGAGIEPGATLRLSRVGQVDIPGVGTDVSGTTAVASFDLRGQQAGPWDVIVENPSGTTTTLPGAFVVEAEAGAPDLWVEVVGLDLIRGGRAQSFEVFYGNRGNVDALGVPLWISATPGTVLLEPGGDFIESPLLDGVSAEELATVPPDFIAPDGRRVLPVLISRIPAGSSGVLEVRVTAPNGIGALELNAKLTTPWFSGVAAVANASGSSASAATTGQIVDCIADVLFTVAGAVPQAACVSGWLEQLYNDIRGRAKPGHLSMVHAFYTVAKGCIGLGGYETIRSVVWEALGLLEGNINISSDCAAWWSAQRQDGPKEVVEVTSFDPNVKFGPSGVGAEHFVATRSPVTYSISFENLETASAPAQEVVVSDALDSTAFDVGSLSLGPIRFGSRQVVPPLGSSSFSADVDLRPAQTLVVRVTESLNPATGLLSCRLTSIDPSTGDLPADPTVGFLPPDVDPPEGDGGLTFSISPRQDLPTGAVITNQASIVFDTNAPVGTAEWVNTLDGSLPISEVTSVEALPNTACFTVTWVGSDVGAGIGSYAISSSEDGGPFAPFLEDTMETSAQFAGKAGSTYQFYSVATDLVGNREVKEVAEATASAPATVADFDGDCCVDANDYDILMADVRGTGSHDPRFDLNGDGAVNRADARTFLGLYSANCGSSPDGTNPTCGLGWELVVVLPFFLRRFRRRRALGQVTPEV